MTYRLLGPHPFDLAAPAQSARMVLSAFASDAEPGSVEAFRESNGNEPGLYLLVDDRDALRGFWLVFGSTYLDDGVGAGRIPPYAEELLEAATEEIWWERLRVTPLRGSRWSPIVVLEWPRELAERSSMPPPGVRPSEASLQEAEEDWEVDPDTTWIEPAVPIAPGFDEPERIPTARLRWISLSDQRSLLAVIQGDLGRRAGIHEGRYRLASIPMPSGAVAKGIPLDTWVDSVEVTAPPAVHEMMHPVQLPGGRAGFPITGWLSRDLEVSPSDPTEVLPGNLVSRDIHSRIWGQMALAVSITLLVLVSMLGVSAVIHLAAMPRLQTAVAVPPVAAQPAMSVCSADHTRFVDAFRCEIRHLAAGGQPGEAECGEDPGEDLQAAYCGIRDRSIDGWVSTETGHGFAQVAAASACFRVLGTPFPYAVQGTNGTVPDPAKLLDDSQLKVSALVDLVSELDTVCGVYRNKLESRVGGAVLATHVGDNSPEGTELADLVFRNATTGASAIEAQCYDSGRRDRAGAEPQLDGICGPDPQDQLFAERKSWAALAGSADSGALERYVAARFGNAGTARGLWACHIELAEGVGGPPIKGQWDFSLPRPRTYANRGVRSQLRLDAGLAVLREEGTDDPCWSEISGMLGSYEPVHPLLSEPDAEGWPSAEQQVCAQACAANYRIASAPRNWVTPGADLGWCTTQKAPPSDTSSLTENRIDRLRLPWNQSTVGEWVEPSTAEVCAFNLVAQGQLDSVPEDLASPLWAGELSSGSGVAGGESGAAVRAALALGTFGHNRSSSTCGYVAVQCFAGELLDVLSDRRLESHQWAEQWRRRVRGLPSQRAAEISPWCRLVQPYIREDGTLPEGEFDFPCALGVEESRQRTEGMIRTIAAGSFAEGAP